MLCAISGTVPEQPVVSKKSGHLYEKRLILKVLKETGRDPVTNESLEEDDLVELATATSAKPRPTPATSIPGLLTLFQNEWDATVLEVHQLRQALHTARQELSHALYQHDAATRVIARLIRERDGFRQQLEAAQLPPPAGKRPATAAPEGMDVDQPAEKKAKAGITPDIAERLTATSAALSKGRKKRVVPDGTATADDIAGYSLAATFPLHKTSKGGILSLDLSPENEAVVATAGGDGSVQVFDRAAGRVLASLEGHSKKVHAVRFVGKQSLLASASADKTLRLWQSGGEAYSCAHTFSDQAGEVVAVAVHPSNDYLITAATDGSWAFYDVNAALCVAQVSDASLGPGGYTCAGLHPDGLILGAGAADSTVRIWETRTQKNVAKFDGHAGPLTSLSFSENGYYMASAAADGVKLWDLRKLKNFKSLAPYESGPTTSVAFDYSGLYLAVGGADARVYGVKQDWAVVKEWADVPKKGVQALAWAPKASALLAGAADHNLRVFAKAE